MTTLLISLVLSLIPSTFDGAAYWIKIPENHIAISGYFDNRLDGQLLINTAEHKNYIELPTIQISPETPQFYTPSTQTSCLFQFNIIDSYLIIKHVHPNYTREPILGELKILSGKNIQYVKLNGRKISTGVLNVYEKLVDYSEDEDAAPFIKAFGASKKALVLFYNENDPWHNNHVGTYFFDLNLDEKYIMEFDYIYSFDSVNFVKLSIKTNSKIDDYNLKINKKIYWTHFKKQFKIDSNEGSIGFDFTIQPRNPKENWALERCLFVIDNLKIYSVNGSNP